ncbi:MAG: SMC family ATPase [Leptolyngbya sp. SIO4C1]|nr:SMC family ATPase [Leptolyngbya sp. SIO4C1]
MHLLSVTLTNFKAHRDRHVEFQLGTNAIGGENGAGKTSLLEAIAWVLFNYQGSYRKEDLIRSGSGSAQVRVAFVSGRDSRTYEVERCTNRGYTLFDPQLNQRLPYSRIKDEVMPWLRQHLGVAAGTDLGELFANTVGVPQGTFTADFLLSPDKRKPIFDTILKVEEYRTVYLQTNGLRKYAEAQAQQLKDQIAQYDERLEAWEALQQRAQALQAEIAADQAEQQQLEARLTQMQAARTEQQQQAQQLQQLDQQRQRLAAQYDLQHQAQRSLNQAAAEARAAAEICQQQQQAYQAFLAAETALRSLAERARARQPLLQQQTAQQQRLTQCNTTLARLQGQLEPQTQMQQSLETLQPAIAQQQRLEQQRADLAAQQQALSQAQLKQEALMAQQTSLAQQQQTTQAEIERLQAFSDSVAQIPQWEAQRQRLQQQLSRLEAAQQFEAELQQLVRRTQTEQATYSTQTEAALQSLADLQTRLPLSKTLVDQLRTAIATGQQLAQATLDTLGSILQDLSQQVDARHLQQQLGAAQQQLQRAYQQQADLNGVSALQQRLDQLQGQQTQLQPKLAAVAQQRQQHDLLSAQLVKLDQQLSQLDNPRAQARLLQERIEALTAVQQSYQQQQQQQQTLMTALAELEAQLQGFADLEAAMAEQQQRQQAHQPGYLRYLQHEKAAQTLPQVEAEQQTVAAALAALEAQQQTAAADYQQLAADFDPDRLQQLEVAYSELKSKCDRLLGSLPQQQKLQQEMATQIEALQSVAARRDRARAELKQRERIKRFIKFARKVYKDAGPRITERYVQSISQEADRIFRELLNRPNTALQWTQDYDIVVQEGAHKRRFINLSGGEQMCAALAVRLALLKVLADIDVAFFDEPTTNMDRLRRESLAEAICRLRRFQQIFVISHDDTFEQVTENVIVIERE